MSGTMIQIVVGHFNFCGLFSLEFLSIFISVCWFTSSHHWTQTDLRTSVTEELLRILQASYQCTLPRGTCLGAG